MFAQIPTHWVKVDTEAFEGWLKDGPEFRRDAFGNATFYRMKHNGEWFAAIEGKDVFIDPKHLAK